MRISDTYKMVIVLDDMLPVGLKCNTAAVLSLTIGDKFEGLIGHDVTDKSGENHIALSNYPLPILKTTKEKLHDLYTQAKSLKENLLLIDITDAAQSSKNYPEYEGKIQQRETKDLNLLGIALCGDKKIISKLTGNFGLLR